MRPFILAAIAAALFCVSCGDMASLEPANDATASTEDPVGACHVAASVDGEEVALTVTSIDGDAELLFVGGALADDPTGAAPSSARLERRGGVWCAVHDGPMTDGIDCLQTVWEWGMCWGS